MSHQPKIKIKPTAAERNLDLVAVFLYVAMWLLTAYAFRNSPEIIPTHFNASGTPDDYGDKFSLWLLPFIASVIYFGISLLNKYPHFFNYTGNIAPENAETKYRQANRMLRYLKIGVLFIFTLLILGTYLTSAGVINNLGKWFLPFVLILMLLPVIITIVIAFKMKE